MNRRLTFLISAFEALVVAAIGIGITLAPLSVVWLFENDPTIDWLVPFRASADVWLMAHGTRLVVPAGMFGSAEVPLFVISIIPLGLSLVIAHFAYRFGKKLTTAIELWPGWLSAAVTYGAVSFFVSSAAFSDAAYPVTWQGTFFPPVFFLFFVLLGSLIGKREAFGEAAKIPESAERIGLRVWWGKTQDSMHWSLRALLEPALRAGTAVVAMLLGVSAVMIALLTAINWIQVIRLYEGLQVSFLGGLMITAGQMVIMPNLVVLGASWLTGVGFQIGAGSLISPIGTIVAPLPALPIVATVPVGQMSFALAAVLVPMISAWVATILVRRHAGAIRFEFASAFSAAISLGLSIAFVAAVEMGLLAVLASGGIGPDRLQTFGVNPFLLMGVLFIEVAIVAIPAAFISARPLKPDHPLVTGR